MSTDMQNTTMRLMLHRYGEAIKKFSMDHEIRFGEEVKVDLEKAAAILQGEEASKAERRALSARLDLSAERIGSQVGEETLVKLASWRFVLVSLARRIEVGP
jgi:uncharacterized protein YacL (UPF0231 family)